MKIVNVLLIRYLINQLIFPALSKLQLVFVVLFHLVGYYFFGVELHIYHQALQLFTEKWNALAACACHLSRSYEKRPFFCNKPSALMCAK